MLQLIDSILEFLLGHKYYAIVVGKHGIQAYGLSSFIFPSKEEAQKHIEELKSNQSFYYVELVSFRSRNTYHKVNI